MKLSVQFAGYDKLSLRVKYLQQAASFGLKAGVSEACLLFETEAKAIVPVDTGRLRDSIHTETVDEADEQVHMRVTPTVPAGNEYGFDPPYARRIEYGFVGPDKLGRVYHQAPQPYMRPAFDSQKDEAQKRIKDSILMELSAATNAAAASSNRRRG